MADLGGWPGDPRKQLFSDPPGPGGRNPPKLPEMPQSASFSTFLPKSVVLRTPLENTPKTLFSLVFEARVLYQRQIFCKKEAKETSRLRAYGQKPLDFEGGASKTAVFAVLGHFWGFSPKTRKSGENSEKSDFSVKK